MIVKIYTEEARPSTIIEVTPDDLMVIARRMHLEADKALPGEEILVPITERITLKYNPEITTAAFAARSQGRQSLPGTSVSSLIDSKIAERMLEDTATGTGAGR
jgi:hypothetical protein